MGGGPRFVPCFPSGPFYVSGSQTHLVVFPLTKHHMDTGSVCFLLFLQRSALQGTSGDVLTVKVKERNTTQVSKQQLKRLNGSRGGGGAEPVWTPGESWSVAVHRGVDG